MIDAARSLSDVDQSLNIPDRSLQSSHTFHFNVVPRNVKQDFGVKNSRSLLKKQQAGCGLESKSHTSQKPSGRAFRRGSEMTFCFFCSRTILITNQTINII